MPALTVIATLCTAGLRAFCGSVPRVGGRDFGGPWDIVLMRPVPPCPCSHTTPLSHPARMKMPPAWCLRSWPPCRGFSHGSNRRPRDIVLCGLQQISTLLPTTRSRVAACQPGSSLKRSCQISSLGSLAQHHGLTQMTGLRDIPFPNSNTQRPSSFRFCFAPIAFVALVVLVSLCERAPTKPVSRMDFTFC